MPRMNLRDDQWERIEHLLPGKAGDRGYTAADNRLFVDAVLWLARSGAPWRDLPEEFGRWNSVYKRFARWEKRGVWHRIFAELAGDADFEEVFIDSTVIRAHQHAAGARKEEGAQAIGRSRGGLTTKIHALVESLGNLARWRLTPGQAADVCEAEPLLAGIPAQAVAADKAYDSDALIDTITASGAQAVIPPRANRNAPRGFDRHLYKGRNLVERFFCRIKHFRRIATRYEKLDRRYEAFIAITAAWIWLA
jgi:transposase